MPDNNLPAVQYYTPVELVGIYRSFLERGKSNGVVWLRGIYMQKPNQSPQWAAFYDELRDVSTNVSVTLKINRQDRIRLQSNSLVQVGGIIELNPFTNGTIQIVVNVTRFEIVKDQFITEQELKLFDLRKKKLALGLKNVKASLSQVIIEGKRKPRVALVLAQSSITQADFEDGLRAARASFEFTETRVAFTQAEALCSVLRSLDDQCYDAIAIYRGGGIDPNSDVDKPTVIETVINLKTPFVSGVGHKPEKIFLREVADHWTATPQGLGQFFSEIHESASAMRNNSRAALIEDIKKQFKDQLEAGKKQNKELQEKLAKLTKNQEEATKKHNEQVQALTKAQTEATKQHKEQVETIQKQHKEQLEKTNKQNEELQKKLGELTKTHTEQMGKLQGQMKAQTEASAKQSKEFNESLKKMQDTNGELNKSLQKLTTQNTQAAKDLQEAKDRARDLEKKLSEALAKSGSNMWMIIAIIAALAFVAALILK